MILGIDASNIRIGGGITHLVELLTHFQPQEGGFDQVVVWGNPVILAHLPQASWLEGRLVPEAKWKALAQIRWQGSQLSREAKTNGCDVLFVPGGTYIGNFHPTAVMCRNMLPFNWHEIRRYGISRMTAKLAILRLLHSYTFKRADGVVFLTEYAKVAVLSAIRKPRGILATIPHGVSHDFEMAPRKQRAIADCTFDDPMRLIYVSTVDLYKHQWHVAEAVGKLRDEGLPLSLDLVGSGYPPAIERLQAAAIRLDPLGKWLHYRGPADREEVREHYRQAEIGVYASSCENLPNILLEMMAAGLPIACSNRGPMPEVLGGAGSYFDPEDPKEIAATLKKMVNSPELRQSQGRASQVASQEYSWIPTTAKTIEFLAFMIHKN
jgi:glycosyltransferase involved in cell wall biosynthesis